MVVDQMYDKKDMPTKLHASNTYYFVKEVWEECIEAFYFKCLVSLKSSGCGALNNISASPTPTIRTSKSIISSSRVMGWFDGAALSNEHLSGARGLIKTSENFVYKWTFNCGKGTNTREKLLRVWVTLTLARRLHIVDMQIMGDSKIVIEWLNKKGNL